ncbi:diguanylate cyclase [Segnochrobactraceae bacterium EtOH-i3]
MTSDLLMALLSPMVAGFIALLLIVIWYHHRDRRHVLLFGLGFLVGGVAFVVRDFALASGAIAPVPGRFLGNGLFLGTALAMCAAVHTYYRRRVPVWIFGAIALAGTVAFSWYLLATDDLVARVYVVHLTMLTLVAVTFVRVFARLRRTTIDFAILFGMAAAVINLILPLIFVGRTDAGIYRSITLVSAVMLEVILALVFLAVLAAELLKAIRQEARIDVLSRLPNRRGMEEDVHALLMTGAASAALILMDIDHFKRINDAFGHAVGDEVIRACGALLNGVAAPDVLVGRVGGEEFALCVARGGPEAAATLAETLRARLAEMPVSARVPELRVTASFGVAPAGDGADLTTVLAHADAALYIAKRAGRNRVRVVSPPFPAAERGDSIRRRAFRDRPS